MKIGIKILTLFIVLGCHEKSAKKHKEINAFVHFANNVKNFPYNPAEYLKGKTICVTGKVSEYNGTPSMSIENGKSSFLYEEED